MSEFERLWIWNEPDLAGQLSWYRQVAVNRRPAKFRIAQQIPVAISLKEASEEALWKELEEQTPRFLDLWNRIRQGICDLPSDPPPVPNLVDLCRELTRRMLRHCNFCQWECGVDRGEGTKLGTCKLAEESRVSSYFHHPGEELIYRGRQGSGTIFFTSCNMRCAFCTHPDTFVLTPTGPARIARLYAESGSEKEHHGGWSRSPETLHVFSHDGRPVHVTRIFKHEYSGDLMLIEPFYGPPIRVTPEHQIPASRGLEAPLVKTPAAQLSPGHWLAIPRPAFPAGEMELLDVVGILSSPETEPAAATTTGCWPPSAEEETVPLLFATEERAQAATLPRAGVTSFSPTRQGVIPRPSDGCRTESHVTKPSYPNALLVEGSTVRLAIEKRPGIPGRLEISEPLAELLGYYCARGEISKKRNGPDGARVALCFGRHEEKRVARVAVLLRKLFGLKPRVVERGETIVVEVRKPSLALLLSALCGSHAATKRVPAFLFQAPAPVVLAYLRAYSSGAGHLSEGTLSLQTTSEALAMGLYGLYLRLGHLPGFNVDQPPPENPVEGNGDGNSPSYSLEVREDRTQESGVCFASRYTAEQARYRFGENAVLVPIRRVSRVPYSGPVYNLEVDDDSHTYAANFIAIGNCQNGDISTDKDNGEAVSSRTLATMAWLLRMEGCHNINWVGGEVTIHLHTIVEAISILDELDPSEQDLRIALATKSDRYIWFALNPRAALYQGRFNAPMLWNSNFFMSLPAMRILRLLIDVWLPDFKFGPGRCAVTLSRTPWYWETITGNLKRIHDWGEEFTIRHLVMPNHVECCTLPVLQWIAQTMPEAPVNIMDQYHPDNFCDPRSPKYSEKYAEIARRPTSEEVLQAFRYARELGLRFEALSYEKNTTGLCL